MWVDDVYAGIRNHPITPDTTWLIATAAALAVELTGALEREAALQARLDGFEGDGTDEGGTR